MDPKIIITYSSAETEKIGEEFAKKIKGKNLILLKGKLGSGKTTFVKGLAKGLRIGKKILSPTFILLKSYQSPSGKILNHIDLYRLEKINPQKLGLEELLKKNNSITVIEWGEKLDKSLLKSDELLQIRQIDFEYINESQREITINE